MKTTRTTTTSEPRPNGCQHEIITHESNGCTIEISRPVGHGGGRFNTVRVNGTRLLGRNGNPRAFSTEAAALEAGMKAARERTFLDRTAARAQAEAGRQDASADTADLTSADTYASLTPADREIIARRVAGLIVASANAPSGPTDEQMIRAEMNETWDLIDRLEDAKKAAPLDEGRHDALMSARAKIGHLRADLENAIERSAKTSARDKVYQAIAGKNKADQIAADLLGIESLAPVNSDRADFHEIACWNLQAALVTAYMAGHKAGKVEAK